MTPEGYPDDAELDRIAQWPFGDYHAMLVFVRSLRWDGCGSWTEREEEKDGESITVYRLATGGWSGNESLISAMEQNRMFMATCWQMSVRGGLYVYHVSELAGGNP